jgi:hypothetical protein
VRDRRKDNLGAGARLARVAGSLALRMWAKAVHRPVDCVAILSATAATILITVNAVFLQSGARQAPFVANPAPPMVTGAARPKPAEQAAAKPMPQAIPARSDDPIAELIGPSPRILAVQRVLSEFGYGQIKPSGILDDATSSAIEIFEREHKLPITGRVSDRLVSDLSAMVGRPVQ